MRKVTRWTNRGPTRLCRLGAASAVPPPCRTSSLGGPTPDGDGVPDTLLTVDGPDLLVQTDLDTDGVVDRVVRIGLDGAIHTEPSGDPVGGARVGWPGLLRWIFGPDT